MVRTCHMSHVTCHIIYGQNMSTNKPDLMDISLSQSLLCSYDLEKSLKARTQCMTFISSCGIEPSVPVRDSGGAISTLHTVGLPPQSWGLNTL